MELLYIAVLGMSSGMVAGGLPGGRRRGRAARRVTMRGREIGRGEIRSTPRSPGAGAEGQSGVHPEVKRAMRVEGLQVRAQTAPGHGLASASAGPRRRYGDGRAEGDLAPARPCADQLPGRQTDRAASRARDRTRVGEPARARRRALLLGREGMDRRGRGAPSAPAHRPAASRPAATTRPGAARERAHGRPERMRVTGRAPSRSPLHRRPPARGVARLITPPGSPRASPPRDAARSRPRGRGGRRSPGARPHRPRGC
jgi:hypothetical protein